MARILLCAAALCALAVASAFPYANPDDDSAEFEERIWTDFSSYVNRVLQQIDSRKNSVQNLKQSTNDEIIKQFQVKLSQLIFVAEDVDLHACMVAGEDESLRSDILSDAQRCLSDPSSVLETDLKKLDGVETYGQRILRQAQLTVNRCQSYSDYDFRQSCQKGLVRSVDEMKTNMEKESADLLPQLDRDSTMFQKARDSCVQQALATRSADALLDKAQICVAAANDAQNASPQPTDSNDELEESILADISSYVNHVREQIDSSKNNVQNLKQSTNVKVSQVVKPFQIKLAQLKLDAEVEDEGVDLHACMVAGENALESLRSGILSDAQRCLSKPSRVLDADLKKIEGHKNYALRSLKNAKGKVEECKTRSDHRSRYFCLMNVKELVGDMVTNLERDSTVWFPQLDRDSSKFQKERNSCVKHALDTRSADAILDEAQVCIAAAIDAQNASPQPPDSNDELEESILTDMNYHVIHVRKQIASEKKSVQDLKENTKYEVDQVVSPFQMEFFGLIVEAEDKVDPQDEDMRITLNACRDAGVDALESLRSGILSDAQRCLSKPSRVLDADLKKLDGLEKRALHYLQDTKDKVKNCRDWDEHSFRYVCLMDVEPLVGDMINYLKEGGADLFPVLDRDSIKFQKARNSCVQKALATRSADAFLDEAQVCIAAAIHAQDTTTTELQPTQDATTVTPSPQPTTDGTTDAPTPEPTDAPTPEPTDAPTTQPTDAPTPEPTDAPTPEPTDAPTPEPTDAPTPEPTEDGPTDAPISQPTEDGTTVTPGA